jgi:hypothetical protein
VQPDAELQQEVQERFAELGGEGIVSPQKAAAPLCRTTTTFSARTGPPCFLIAPSAPPLCTDAPHVPLSLCCFVLLLRRRLAFFGRAAGAGADSVSP